MSNLAEIVQKSKTEPVPVVRILTEGHADDKSLATLFDLDGLAGTPRVWQSRELAEVLNHQMAALIHLDLPATEEPTLNEATSQAVPLPSHRDAYGETPKTFGELFDHPKPPPDLLERTKQFAKACKQNVDGRVPEEIAIVLYYLSILSARLRHGQRITQLDDTALAVGVRTALSRNWLDDRARRILNEGLRTLTEPCERQS